jgi:MPBQ/MSBQ methyltransferase
VTQTLREDQWLTAAERAEVRKHLEREYAAVFGEVEIAFHLNSHVCGAFADYACQVIAMATPTAARVLDVGCGYGSFVILARERRFDAIGTDVARYEIEFARRRLARLRPHDSGDAVFLDGGIFNAALDQRRFDAITFWNVLEHIEDIRTVLARAVELLAPGGTIYIVCPNYAAWRKEAHYQVPWRPFLSRSAAVARLRQYGKDPRFFERAVFQRTSWEVMRILWENGLRLYDRLALEPLHPGLDAAVALLKHPRTVLDYFNPFRPAVELAARKPRSFAR